MNSSFTQATDFGIVNGNTSFGKIAALTVDQFNSQTAVLNNSGQVYLIRSDKKLYQMPGNFPIDQNKQIEIDPQSSAVFVLEFAKNDKNILVFSRVRKISMSGESTSPITKDNFEGNYFVIRNGQSFKKIELGTELKFDLERINKTVMFKVSTKEGSHFWVNLNTMEVLDIFKYMCLRTGDCDGSVDLMAASIYVMGTMINDTDSAGNKYQISNCQIEVNYKNPVKTEFIGKSCQ